MNKRDVLIVLFVVFFLAVINFSVVNYFRCHSKWDDAKWTMLAGCMVENGGEFVPEANIRVIKWIEVEGT